MLLKLHTTESTNSFLKKWISKNKPENFMIVSAQHQTAGRGQMGSIWNSKQGKNLTFSMYVNFSDFKIEKQFALNQAISLGLINALIKHLSQVKIKWPNDILADKKKLAGILIENVVSNNKIKHSIIGIGLNVNQEIFPKELPNASSLRLLTHKNYDLDKLLLEIKDSIKQQLHLIEKSPNLIQENYLKHLYLFQEEASFSDKKGRLFKGSIVGVADDGQLLIHSEKNNYSFAFKEVKFIL
jgi:BirA family biotin operon repressor/biotin-[acetyl-CoA-carboxylase] ligase